jgi:putative ubiquitin-RnfH superfamily antitoxin RatB of RatAB toxin-antitoxin module
MISKIKCSHKREDRDLLEGDRVKIVRMLLLLETKNTKKKRDNS